MINQNSAISGSKIIARFTMALLFYAALLFVPAGTLNWPEAWLFISVYFAWAIPVVVWLKKNNPGLLEERMRIFKKPAKGWDKLIILAATILFIAMFAVAGFDIRYRWSEVPFFLKVLGFAGFVPSLVLIFLVMRENTYLSRIVEIRKGQKVITTGPYRYVRHPMYAGVIALFLCTPPALGSLYALIPGSLLAVLIIIRTYLEDKTLHEELQGYKEYAGRTRYRLLPGFW